MERNVSGSTTRRLREQQCQLKPHSWDSCRKPRLADACLLTAHRHLGVLAHTCRWAWHSGGRIRTNENSRLPWSSSNTPPLPIQKRGIRTHIVVPNKTILKTTLPLWHHFTDFYTSPLCWREQQNEEGHRAVASRFSHLSMVPPGPRSYSNASA